MSNYYTEILEPKFREGTSALILYLKGIGLLKNQLKCNLCNNLLKFAKYSRNIDGHANRCMNNTCKNYKKYFSIRDKSIFEKFNLSLEICMKIIYK